MFEHIQFTIHYTMCLWFVSFPRKLSVDEDALKRHLDNFSPCKPVDFYVDEILKEVEN